MIWIISFFTLIGVNFTIWALIGLLRYYNEEKLEIKNLYIPKKAPPHSLTRWLFVFWKITGLNFLFFAFTNLSRKIFKFIIFSINWINKKLYISNSLKKIFNNFTSYKNSSFPNLLFPDSNLRPIYLNSTSANLQLSSQVNVQEVAAIIPAHNEELTIAKTIKSLKKIMPAKNIYVGSDASTDNTIKIANNLGVNVYDINPNKGKANVLTFLIKYYKLVEKYKAVLIIDADSEVDENYLKKALPLFDDPEVSAIAAHAMSKWISHWPPRPSMLYTAYRVRLYRVLQAVMRYGQTWKYTNVITIIPGFASMYRTSVLPYIKINAPGLVIEDYNMTFEIQHKKLGKIAYSPGVRGKSQDPLNFKDYFKQIKRWNLGFWQTVKRHGFWISFFWLSISIFIIEILLFGFFLLLAPFIFLWFFIFSFDPIYLPFTLPIINSSQLTFLDILISVLLIDYLITFIVAIYEKKPILLIYGLVFFVLRYVDAFILFYTLPLAFITESDGKWVSPKRQIVET